jgi:cob(I)alamin adenosyltransferase
MARVYTRAGDTGQTGLIDGSRVPKDDLRVAAYGEVDELNAVLGLARNQAAAGEADLLLRLQKDLFALGAQLADPTAAIGQRKAKAALTPAHVALLESTIDAREAQMPPLKTFLLPGGTALGALFHLARTVCRRAERAVVALDRRHHVDPLALTFLNRLSDLLFILARHENLRAGRAEEPW